MNAYQRHGYSDREEYLGALATEYALSIEEVLDLAELCGENEDFDGLPTLLEEMN